MIRSIFKHKSRTRISVSHTGSIQSHERSTKPKITLIPDLLPLVIPYADQLTLCYLALVSHQINRLATPVLYDIIQLHTPYALATFFQRPKKPKVRHIELILDIEFCLNPGFRKCVLDYEVDHDRSYKRKKGWLDGLESFLLITRGRTFINVVEEKMFRRRDLNFSLSNLVHIWITRLTPLKGPKHFKWRHVSYDSSLSYDTNQNGSLGKPNWDLDSPYPLVAWPFTFLSDYTSTTTIELPLTPKPINGFKLSNLQLQILEYLSFGGTTISKSTLSGLLWEINRGKRSKLEKRFVLEIRGQVGDDIQEGLDQLKSNEDKGLLKVLMVDRRNESPFQWRERMRKRNWENY